MTEHFQPAKSVDALLDSLKDRGSNPLASTILFCCFDMAIHTQSIDKTRFGKRFLLGWIVPMAFAFMGYYLLMEYDHRTSAGEWGGFGYFVFAPFFFLSLGVLNFWVMSLRSASELTILFCGFIIPITFFVLLCFLS